MKTLKFAVGIVTAASVATLALVACNGESACAAGPGAPAPRPPAPAYRAPAPAYKAPAAPKQPAYKAPASRPTVYKTRYENGHPIVYPVILPVDYDEDDCD